MFRYRHRRSKDIDVFVPDPQYLGYVNPRLSGAAAEVSQDYVEAAGYVKLIRADGEIDFVASRKSDTSSVRVVAFERQGSTGRDRRRDRC